jgi:HlyD family secretion protein
MTRNLSYALGAALVLAVAAGSWFTFRSSAEDGLRYETKIVDRGTIERVVSASGDVNPLVTVQVGTQVSGQISVVDVDFNSKVKKGQRLALIDPQSFTSRVTQAASDLAGARTQVALQAANFERAQAQLLKERRALERSQTLADKGFSSTATLDLQKATVASANADVAVAKAQVANAKSVIAARDAALTQAKIDLSRTQILSPIDGIVIERNVDNGQTVAASLQAPTLFKIAQDLSQIQINVQVDEADIGAVKAGQGVAFNVASFPQRDFRGQVSQVRVGGVSEQSVVTYTVVVAAPNRDQALMPGMTASVKITTGRRENVLRIPSEALRFRPPGAAQPASTAQAGENRGNRRETMIAELTTALSLDDKQQAALRAALPARQPGSGSGQRRPAASGDGQASADGGDAAPRVGPSGGGGGGRGFDGAIVTALEPLLTDAQKAALETWRSTRMQSRRAQIWVLRGGSPAQISVTTGIADDRFTEVLSGLKEGDAVITRANETGV